MLQLQSDELVKHYPDLMDVPQRSEFTPEISWFVYSFFKKLTPNEKLMFYGYYIVGMNLECVAERFHVSIAYVGKCMEKINDGLRYSWAREKGWGLPNDSKPRARKHSKEDKRRSK